MQPSVAARSWKKKNIYIIYYPTVIQSRVTPSLEATEIYTHINMYTYELEVLMKKSLKILLRYFKYLFAYPINGGK